MLYLRFPADETSQGPPRRVPLAEHTALQLERAILCSDAAKRRELVHRALEIDGDFSAWTLRTAELRSSQTIGVVEEAADWLAERLVGELAASLQNESSDEAANEIEWRLPALVAKFEECERAIAEFDRRLEREKLDSLKELAYGASHEINNPLANIAARAQTLLDDERNPERARKLSAIHRQAMRAHEMISDLMLFARPPKLVARSFDLSKLAARVVDELSDLADEASVAVTCDAANSPIDIVADETQIGVALQALLKNAIEASTDGGVVRVTTRVFEIGDQRAAEVSVADDGPGISDEVRRHMFDPFYSGREAGRGLGFGLSKCWRIVTDHGGEVIVLEQRSGAEIAIRLPLPTG